MPGFRGRGRRVMPGVSAGDGSECGKKLLRAFNVCVAIAGLLGNPHQQIHAFKNDVDLLAVQRDFSLLSGDKAVKTAAGAEIDDPLANAPSENGLPTPANASTALSGKAVTAAWS